MALRRPRPSGFTFIEVLIAMAIFTIAVLAAVDIASGAVRAAQEAKDVSMATWLLQQKMVELETALETDGIDKACEKEDSGKFEAPNERFSWETSCEEIDFKISETAAKLAAAGGEEEADRGENQILKLVLDTASKYISSSVREVHVAIHWKTGRNEKTIDATTHFARYDQKVGLGGVVPGGAAAPAADTGETTQ